MNDTTLMNPDTVRNTGPQRRDDSRPSFSPYHRRIETHSRATRATTTRSRSISRLARANVSPRPPNYHQANVTHHTALRRRLLEQVPYVPVRKQGDFTPAEPVSFSMNGIPGISVAQAIAEEFTGLDDRDECISSFEGSKILCRVELAGHDLYTSKVNTRRHVAGWTPIFRCKLAKEIGKRMREYVEQVMGGGLDLERVYLTRLIHVSKGSWQPELFYEDLVSPELAA
ncbi:hypothetical protein BJ322DRAFT_1210340 [Thelephora terrestris]|uniref:Uncharacterized protein n=1 Tax=Thelephora terrestris TaxID=56493 RepID=A0A9P6HGD5_9AGAM|nr:hypothetical protein BJ322DRAFT_1210340 [Thelephora terrestris]